MCGCKNLFHFLPTGNKELSIINVLVEIPKGSKIKYEFDKELGVIKVDRYLFQDTPFFYDYGLIPQSWMAGDDDPLDAIVLTNEAGYPGTLVETRVIGLISIDDSGEQDDKVLCVPAKDPRWDNVKEVEDLNSHMKKELVFFLEHYAALQPGKTVKVVGWKTASEAIISIKIAKEEYKNKFPNDK